MDGARVVRVDGRAVRVTSVDRPLWRDEHGTITKGDLVDYYLAVGEPAVRALAGRPSALERWPRGVVVDGQEGEHFYGKHAPKGLPEWVSTMTVRFPSGRPGRFVVLDDVASVVWAVNLGTVCFHPWPVTRVEVDRPDELRVDLDPPAERAFADVVAVARVVREVLAEMGLTGFVKTSGGRGLHVYAPIEPTADFVEARHAAIAVGRAAERRRPDLVTTSWWKEGREGKVFCDFNQMARDRSTASAWSVRARPGAPVSVPLHWDELDDVDPHALTVRTVPSQLAERGDPWASMRDHTASVDGALDAWAADVESGLGELPYPPDYPKMPGEPPRVAPSRRRTD